MTKSMTSITTPGVPEGLVIFGFGGHARSVADVALAAGVRSLVFIDENARDREHFQGFPVQKNWDGVLAPGWQVFSAAGNNCRRQTQSLQLEELGLAMATIVAPSATVGVGAEVARGCFIGHHAHVGSLTKLGPGCIINTGAIVEHDCLIGAFAHISIHAAIAGRSTVGKLVFVCAGATVIDGLSVVDGVTIGAGAVVVASITVPGTYKGVPALKD